MTSKISASSPAAKGSVTENQLRAIWTLVQRTRRIPGAELELDDVLERARANGSKAESFPDLTRYEASGLIKSLGEYVDSQQAVGNEPVPDRYAFEYDPEREWAQMRGLE